MDPSPAGFPRTWYQFQNAFRLALDSIRAHKLRSFLTLLGVIIGVASVIMVGAAIEGLGVYAEQSTAKAFGSESFMVAQMVGGRLSRREVFEKLKHNKQIQQDDANFLRQTNGQDVLYSPYRQRLGDIKRENYICEDNSIIGVSADMVDIRDGCSRTAGSNAAVYADGDEVRIPNGSGSRYVVVWVELINRGTAGQFKRAYLLRDTAVWPGT